MSTLVEMPLCWKSHVKAQFLKRTSDGGNGNHCVSLLIILIKIKVDQMLLFSYIYI